MVQAIAGRVVRCGLIWRVNQSVTGAVTPCTASFLFYHVHCHFQIHLGVITCIARHLSLHQQYETSSSRSIHPTSMAHTLLTSFTFLLFTALTYYILSTLQIRCSLPSPPPSSSADADAGPLTYDSNPPSTNTGAELLFKIGRLHVYGIRSLFTAVVVVVSFVSAMGVLYAVVALRVGVVCWDRSERWRESGGTRSGELEGRCTIHPSPPPSTEPRMTGRVGEMQGQNGQLESLRWRRNREEHLLVRGRERLMKQAYTAQLYPEPRRASSAGALPGRTFEYELPSYYLAKSRRQSEAPLGNASADWRSSGIPSYYFKEHDEHGSSVHGEGEGSRLETTTELRGVISESDDFVPDPLFESLDNGRAGVEKSEGAGEMMTRSLTGSTAVSEDGRRRRRLSCDLADVMAGRNIGESLGCGDDWDPVYCSGWKD